MLQIGPMLAGSGSLNLMHAERLMNGVTEENYARLPKPGGVTIQTNHPAFIFGHLLMYPPRVLHLVERSVPRINPPAHYEPLFKAGADCRDDADGTIYPPLKELHDRFFDAYREAIEAVAGTADEVLVRPNPAEGRMRELFPTLGGALNFYLGSHVQNHLGQMSAWRRAMGLPPA